MAITTGACLPDKEIVVKNDIKEEMATNEQIYKESALHFLFPKKLNFTITEQFQIN